MPWGSFTLFSAIEAYMPKKLGMILGLNGLFKYLAQECKTNITKLPSILQNFRQFGIFEALNQSK
jgi:hypothetical protein